MHLICPTAPAIYFCAEGLTPFLKIRIDLPVGLICRRDCRKISLAREAKQVALQGRFEAVAA